MSRGRRKSGGLRVKRVRGHRQRGEEKGLGAEGEGMQRGMENRKSDESLMIKNCRHFVCTPTSLPSSTLTLPRPPASPLNPHPSYLMVLLCVLKIRIAKLCLCKVA